MRDNISGILQRCILRSKWMTWAENAGGPHVRQSNTCQESTALEQFGSIKESEGRIYYNSSKAIINNKRQTFCYRFNKQNANNSQLLACILQTFAIKICYELNRKKKLIRPLRVSNSSNLSSGNFACIQFPNNDQQNR